MAIKPNDFVILRKENNWKIVQVIPGRQINMCKMKFYLNNLIGQQFETMFKVESGQVVKLEAKDLEEDDADIDKEAAEKDNRNLVDNRDNQKMSKDEIHSLRKQGITGDEIVDQLVENSATFSQKTEFSQQKYLKKKRKKHVAVISVLKANTRNLVEFYYSRGPTKICNLRMDSLAQILTQANVHSGCRLMVVETCSGLIVGSCLERMTEELLSVLNCLGKGSLVHLYSGSAPNRPALTEGYKFSTEYLSILHDFPLNKVATLNHFNKPSATTTPKCEEATESVMVECMEMGDGTQGVVESNLAKDSSVVTSNDATVDADHKNSDNKRDLKRKMNDKEDLQEREARKLERNKKIAEARNIIEKGSMDGLIVAGKFYPTPVLLSLIEYVAPSRPIVVFSPYKEPLIDCFMKLRERGGVLMIKLSEAWLRNYQVLPDRTHPSINMSGGGGYMLTCVTVKLDNKTDSKSS